MAEVQTGRGIVRMAISSDDRNSSPNRRRRIEPLPGGKRKELPLFKSSVIGKGFC